MSNLFSVLAYSLGGIVSLYLIVFKLLGLRVIGSNEVGIVEKWWSNSGNMKDGKFIALDGEAGFQPDILRSGIHFKTCLMYRIHKKPLVTISQGQIGYVFARDGEPLVETQTLGKTVDCMNFQNTRDFLLNGGQKGPQRAILREGVYAFNLAQFIILTESKVHYISLGNDSEEAEIKRMVSDLKEIDGFRPVVISGDSICDEDGHYLEDPMGIVTVHDGPSLSNAETQVVAPIVGTDPEDRETYHNNFQNPEAFLRAGGFRGKQHQVICDGTYFLNKLFCTIEYTEKTIIPQGFAGVVTSFVGEKGEDVTGQDYSHGELVTEGHRGIWETSLQPGKYAFNRSAGSIIQVPTTNVMLQWVNGESGGHSFDENLKEITIITKDAFEPTLPLSVVVHIDYRKAPLVIQRFGDIKQLVNQTLDPMVSAYFKNVTQEKTLIELIQSRSEIQQRATSEMREKFAEYNLTLDEVLIGSPSPNNDGKIQEILNQLSDRQLAEEKIATYESKMKASKKEKELKEVQAKAEQQTELTRSEVDIEIQKNRGKAELEKSKQDAEKKKALTDANAYEINTLSDAKAKEIAKLGISEAISAKEQVNAYGGPQYHVMQNVLMKFADAIKDGHVKIVPDNMVTLGNSNSEGNGSTNILESLCGILLSEKLGIDFKSIDAQDENPFARKIKEDIYKEINKDMSKCEKNADEIQYNNKEKYELNKID